MMIAHLPAGYLLSTALSKKWHITNDRLHQHFLMAGMIGSIFPDIDMLYFYLIDNRQHHHHSFFTHFPIIWMALLLIAALYKKKAPHQQEWLLVMIFSINGLIHMVLDSVVGDIRWLAPINNMPFSLFYVASHYNFWLLNFIFHWSFLIEILITAIAIFVYRNRKLKQIINQRRRHAFSIAT